MIRLNNYGEEYGFKPSSCKSKSTFYPEVMAKTSYLKAPDERKAEMLEPARDDVLEATEKDLISWLKQSKAKTERKK